jgi:hypothetical protein
MGYAGRPVRFEYAAFMNSNDSIQEMAMKLSGFALLALGTLLLSGCVTPEQKAAEQHANDQRKCEGFGFQPGTDKFAECMMQRDAQASYREERQQDMQEHYRQLSLQRSGDERFPICGAASRDSHLDVSGFWYGPDCRAR